MAKTRTAGRDLLIEVHPEMSTQGWAECPSCDGLMLATLMDARRVPDDLADTRHLALAQASHIDPRGVLVALECAECNRERGREVWDAPEGITVVALRGPEMWAAYRRAAVRRAAYSARRKRRR